jgi:hypothetical protein
VTSKFVGTGHAYYEKRIYRAAVSQRLRNTGIGHIDWVQLARDVDWWRALVKTVMKRNFPYNMRNFLAGRSTVSIAIRHLHICIIICV